MENTLNGTPTVAVFLSAGICPSVALWCEVRERGGTGQLVEPYDLQQVRGLIDGAVQNSFVHLL